jgi:hypothetical protein
MLVMSVGSTTTVSFRVRQIETSASFAAVLAQKIQWVLICAALEELASDC